MEVELIELLLEIEELLQELDSSVVISVSNAYSQFTSFY